MTSTNRLTCILILFLSLFSFAGNAQTINNPIQIIPQPNSIELGKGEFKWNKKTKIIITNDNEELKVTADYLADVLANITKSPVKVTKGKPKTKNALILHLGKGQGEESYELDIDKKRIIIEAIKPAGIFYGIQSLLQMIPVEGGKFSLQSVQIKDNPRFSYRGMHLDVSRHFYTKEEVKKFIDLIAMYKFNRFHWHLTDAAGWRLEIKQYPLLTQKTAFRTQANYNDFWGGERKYADEGADNAHGGYYTQDDAREIVAYAASKYITVIPEIEMPGHSEEVFVAYPNLSCSGKPYVDSDFCAGNDDSFTFLNNVLDEVIDIFPSQYIHIGGDEAGKKSWKKCPKCQQRIVDENLKDVDELQSYFIKRISKHLTSRNRNLIGWDEIIDGGLASDATVMVWRGKEKGEVAARHGNHVIMTPGSHCYFDSYQADPTTEPKTIGGYLPLQKVYSFEVTPANDSLAPFYLGGQGNIWTEYMTDFKRVEYMAFPRAIALAETLWSNKESRNWSDFKARMANQYPRLELLDVNYHRPSFEIEMTEKVDTANKLVEVKFESELNNPVIRYTLDGTEPTNESAIYTSPFTIDRIAHINAAVFVDDQIQKPILKRKSGYHRAVGKKVTYNTKWQSYPAGGETALTDGYSGSLTYGDGRWQGFTSNMDVVIDMGSIVQLNSLSANFMQLTGPGVYIPKYVEVSLSNDGVNFEKAFRVESTVPKEYDRLIFQDFVGGLENKQARYIKVFAKNNGGFLFVDELVVN